MEIVFLLLYAGILSLVAPYINLRSEHYGPLVPTGLAIVSGMLLWSILTWVGMPYTDAWIWVIVMFGMPITMWIGGSRIAAIRAKALAQA